MIFFPGSVAGSIQTLGISGDFEVFRTSIYGLSSTVSNWLTLSGFGTTPSSAVWQVYLPNNSEFLNTQQTNFAYGYLSGGGNPSIDASLVPLSARLLVSVLGGTYYSKNVVPLKPYESPLDIPNLQLWLDASDESSVKRVDSFEDEIWYSTSNTSFIQVSPDITLSGDFTIEAWIYKEARSPSGYTIVYGGNAQSGLGNCQLTFDNIVEGSVSLILDSANYHIRTVTTPIALNTYHHIAWVRQGGNISIYVDGVYQPYTILATVSPPTTQLIIRRCLQYVAGGYGLLGAASNFRVVSGTPLYTSDFTPVKILTNVPGTQLLTFQNSTLVNNGNPTITLSQGGTFTVIPPLPSSIEYVNSWLDKSPNALTASQTVINNQTVYLSSEINNLNVLDFDGTDDFLNLSQPIALSSDFTHFFVYRREANTVSQSLGNFATNSQSSFLHWGAGADANYVFSGAERSNSTILSTGVLVAGVRKNEYLQIDSTPIPFTTNWSSTQTVVNVIGRYKNINGNFYQKGSIGEIIHTSIKLPNQEIDLVNRKLYDKWKVPKTPPYNKTTQIILATSISALSTTLGTWAVEPTSFSIQWQKSNNDSIYTNIPLATSTVYTPTTSDYSSFIRSSISASNVVGVSFPSFSNVLHLTTFNVMSATITRTTIFTVSTTPGIWQSTLPIQRYYQWQINTNTGNGWENFGTLTTSTTAYLSAYELTAVDIRVDEQVYNSTLEL
jgi:hypothetical protein